MGVLSEDGGWRGSAGEDGDDVGWEVVFVEHGDGALSGWTEDEVAVDALGDGGAAVLEDVGPPGDEREGILEIGRGIDRWRGHGNSWVNGRCAYLPIYGRMGALSRAGVRRCSTDYNKLCNASARCWFFDCSTVITMDHEHTAHQNTSRPSHVPFWTSNNRQALH